MSWPSSSRALIQCSHLRLSEFPGGRALGCESFVFGDVKMSVSSNHLPRKLKFYPFFFSFKEKGNNQSKWLGKKKKNQAGRFREMAEG